MKKRIVYYDILKILGAMAVIIIHVISEYWYNLNVTGLNFKILTILDTLIRWAVPIYFMISGALFLKDDKKINIKYFYKKNILKIFLIFIFWNFIYTLLDKIIISKSSFTINVFINSFISTLLGKGIYHLWFLVVILGFYICVPVLKLITKKENKNILKYLIIILLIFSSFNTLLSPLFNIKISYPILFSGYLIYFILGYYLTTYEIKRKQLNAIYILGIVSFLITALGTISYSIYLNKPSELFLNYLSPNVILMSSSLFLLAKNKIKIDINKIIKEFSNTYFGIYLIHGLVIGFYEKLGLFQLNIFLPILVILLSLITYITCFISIYIVIRIPIFKKLFSL